MRRLTKIGGPDGARRWTGICDDSEPRNTRVLAAVSRAAGAVRTLARKNYRLWTANALHPSLHFKRIGKSHWSARVGDHYRVAGMFVGAEFLWQWIGTHEEYNHRF